MVTRSVRARPSSGGGGEKSARVSETATNSSTSPHRRRAARVVAMRMRDPLSRGHGYSVATIRVLTGSGDHARRELGGAHPRQASLAARRARQFPRVERSFTLGGDGHGQEDEQEGEQQGPFPG